jgi:hypothetical protein
MVDPDPSPAQIGAENYRKGRTVISGMDVAIETKKGGVRRSKPGAAVPWEVTMPAHYGDIEGTMAADGDPVDIFIGDAGDNGRFWIINQQTPDGKKFDEHKVITGVESADEALRIYKGSFTGKFGDKVFRSISSEFTAEQLRAALPDMAKPESVDGPPGAPAPVKRPPKSFRKTIKVTTPVLVEETNAIEPREIDADSALTALDADIESMRAFIKCLGGA